MTDLLSRLENPQGWPFSAIATVLCGVLLLPAATLFQRGCNGSYPRWAVLGGWFYRMGLIAACLIGITTPFQQPYQSVHVWLTFLAFMSMVAGLAVCLGHAASYHSRFALAALTALQIAALVLLVYLFFTPAFFEGRLWFLAVCEWGLIALSSRQARGRWQQPWSELRTSEKITAHESEPTDKSIVEVNRCGQLKAIDWHLFGRPD